MMFDQDPQLESVGEKTKRAERSVHDTIVLDDDTQIRLGQGTIILRNAYPLWEGVKGDLIRAAIRFRMAKEKPRADAE